MTTITNYLKKVLLVFHTIKHLRLIQVKYQIIYRINYRDRLGIKLGTARFKNLAKPSLSVYCLRVPLFNSLVNLDKEKISFHFLNKSHSFEKSQIDWNLDRYGKLWTYNLNYFEFLMSENLSTDEGCFLIENFISQWEQIKDGFEPFPISLRVINWVKFLSDKEIKSTKIDQSLFQQVQLLLKNLEYHLLANHLLENAYALFFAAYYFKNEDIYVKAKKLLFKQLEEQILQDGAHYERSPMYHQIMLFRLFDIIYIVENNDWKGKETLVYLKSKAEKMTCWLNKITLPSGVVPNVKDSAPGVTPSSHELFYYADLLGLGRVEDCKLLDSGYRFLYNNDTALFVDCGEVSPSYQPGHAHADETNFLLFNDGVPIIVDTGISTYEKSERRQIERSTQSHNCLLVENQSSSQVWGGFRVGKRANVQLIEESKTRITVEHNGFKHLNAIVRRSFESVFEGFNIITKVEGGQEFLTTSFIHFHPDVSVIEKSLNTFGTGVFDLHISDANECYLESYMFAEGFNRLVEAKRLIIKGNSGNKIEIRYAN